MKCLKSMVANKPYREIKNCRLCNSTKLSKFVDFGEVPLGNNLHTNSLDAKNIKSYPLLINQCKDCKHFQLSISVDPKKLYATNYTYLSSVGKSFIKHLEEYATWAFHKFSLSKTSNVLDIGSNDGSCLKQFRNLGCNVLGVDPAKLASDIANKNNIPTLNKFFNTELTDEIILKYGQFDFITSHNVFAHIDDLQSVFQNIYRLLKKEAYFVFEIGYFRDVLESGCFDTTYHEHLDYHHAKPIALYLNSIGFSVEEFSRNKIQGGSLRTVVKKTGKGLLSDSVEKFLENESNSIISNYDFLNSWKSNINLSMKEFEDKVKEFANNGLKIVGYGVPTKATLLLNLANLSIEHIPFIVEDNIHKIGRYLPTSAIPICSVKKIITYKPDIIIILAWNFSDDIINKLSGIINWKCKCVIPLPSYREVLF